MTQRARTRDLLLEINIPECPPIAPPPCDFPPCDMPSYDMPPCDMPSFEHQGRLVFESIEDFPEKGCKKTLYFDKSLGTLYYWEDDEGYIPLTSGSGSVDKSHIDGGGAEDG